MVSWDALDYAKGLSGPADTPAYQRIVNWIRDLISAGELHEGDALPPERDFARLSGLSRGTVSLAYAELKREGILHSAPGRGTRIASDKNVSLGSRKEQALRILSNALERLEGLGFGEREIRAFLHLLQLGRQGMDVQVGAALVDCNPEALVLLGRQLEGITRLSVVPLGLDELPRLEAAELLAFDLVLTTERHAPQIQGQLMRLGFPLDRFLAVAVAPSRETLVALARLPVGLPLAVQAHSPRFAEIIRIHLGSLGHREVQVLAPNVPVPESTHRVVPADSFLAASDSTSRITPFDYQVDRGSLLRVEEAATALLLRKNEGVPGGR